MAVKNNYEILKINPDASTNQIEAALDGYCHQVRRLVTHYKPKIAELDNLGLHVLEKARETLTYPKKGSSKICISILHIIKAISHSGIPTFQPNDN